MTKTNPFHFPSILAAVAVALAVAGCASAPAEKPAEPVSPIDQIRANLAAGGATTAGGSAVQAPASPVMTGGVVTIDCRVCDGVVLLRQLAQARGIKFQEVGPYPRPQLIVRNVQVKAVPLFEFLREVGNQFGGRADVAPIGGSYKNGIEIRYPTFR